MQRNTSIYDIKVYIGIYLPPSAPLYMHKMFDDGGGETEINVDLNNKGVF